eukprot:1161906-Pelagomonas_calceolata.AAC.1
MKRFWERERLKRVVEERQCKASNMRALQSMWPSARTKSCFAGALGLIGLAVSVSVQVRSFGVPNTTISKGKGVVGEWEYAMGANPIHNPTKQSKDAKDALPPFRPSHTHASQRVERIEYLHDPEVPKIKAALQDEDTSLFGSKGLRLKCKFQR